LFVVVVEDNGSLINKLRAGKKPFEDNLKLVFSYWRVEDMRKKIYGANVLDFIA
jgi:hypothetical protein